MSLKQTGARFVILTTKLMSQLRFTVFSDGRTFTASLRMKRTQEKQELSDFLSIDEHGRLIGAEKILKTESAKTSRAIANRLIIWFFLFVSAVIGGVSWLISWHESSNLTFEWITSALLCLTLILPLCFFFAILRYLLR